MKNEDTIIQAALKRFDWKKWDEIVKEYDDMFCHWDEFKEELQKTISDEIKKALRQERKEIARQLNMTILFNEKAIMEDKIVDWGQTLRKFIDTLLIEIEK